MIVETGGTLITNSLRIDGYYFNEDHYNSVISEWASLLEAKAEEHSI
ncbi:MAG: hypothetical protein UZ22_OP11002000595 [Microgenomates bacterium OLB23]|nr:MAG: hypothetical protein UZ22_OP11002000595 [Microgenomates bacterium OLB23]